MSNASREFLFRYRFDDSEWGITIFANDPVEARDKIRCVGMARYEGEVFEKIPVGVSCFGLVPRLIVWWRNLARPK